MSFIPQPAKFELDVTFSRLEKRIVPVAMPVICPEPTCTSGTVCGGCIPAGKEYRRSSRRLALLTVTSAWIVSSRLKPAAVPDVQPGKPLRLKNPSTVCNSVGALIGSENSGFNSTKVPGPAPATVTGPWRR